MRSSFISHKCSPFLKYLKKENNFSSFAPFIPLRVIDMGHQKHPMMKIENPSSYQVTYSKRRHGIIKKPAELSLLCDADVGLDMFSPAGQLTSFSSNNRIEDVFLHYYDLPNESQGGVANEDSVNRSLRRLKHEGDILEKMQQIEDLQQKLQEVNKRQQKALQKIKSYNPDLNKITSDCEAQVHEQFLTDAVRRIQMLKETTADAMNKFAAEESLEASRKRKLEGNDYCHQKTTFAVGPHMNLKGHWNVEGAPKDEYKQGSRIQEALHP